MAIGSLVNLINMDQLALDLMHFKCPKMDNQNCSVANLITALRL